MKTSDFDYNLPPEYIAQTPVEPRDASRLLVLDRASGTLEQARFFELGDFLRPEDILVLNETRVIPARLYARKIPTGGRVEILLLRRQDDLIWEALVRGKGLVSGKRVRLEDGPEAEIVFDLDASHRLIRFEEPLEPYLGEIGHVPLPPYIHRALDDPERYQTVYARLPGSVAAPTAGLHFTPELMGRLKQGGIRFVNITLHIGLDTFAPVKEEMPKEHRIHTEWCQLTPQAAEEINRARLAGGRIVAVGTTSVRTLEAASRIAGAGEVVGALEGSTDLFILPGFEFRAVDILVTNFHLPRSTLIMLVSAFAGRERVLDAYEYAMREGFRFYSFGDAMLII